MLNVYERHPEFKAYFDRVLTSEDFAESKPHPDCYLKGASYFGVEPEDCVGLEDSFNGLKAVRASGAFTLGLATTNSREAIQPRYRRQANSVLSTRLTDASINLYQS